jgi:hypothetical protein
VLRIYSKADQKTVIQFLDYVMARLSFPVERAGADPGRASGGEDW